MELGHPELQRGVWAPTPQATRWADGQAPLRSYNMFPESVEKLGHYFQSTRKILVTLMKLLI